ncbi:MAG: amidohydrolase family protein [Chlamydiales bacterium]|nr:amidohydrolase family protein [Chlamydiales bacterium]
MDFFEGIGLTELHTHVGFGMTPTMLWEIAHDQGMILPTKDYWQFEKLVTIHETKEFDEYLKMYDLTERIQSSPESLFIGIQNVISGAYRKNNITKIELRFNPMLRNREGERDLDHIIVFTLQGMERAMLKYPVQAGLILMMDRRFSPQKNAIIARKAIKYKERGVVGIDLGGPNVESFSLKELVPIVDEAREHGIEVTIHTGETTDTDEMWEVIRLLKPSRIGHGIACVKDKKLMRHLMEKHIVLETCPTSNLNTKVVKDFDHMREIYKTLKEHKVPFTINTDGPEMQKISLKKEFMKLLNENILTPEEILQSNAIATKASFIS